MRDADKINVDWCRSKQINVCDVLMSTHYPIILYGMFTVNRYECQHSRYMKMFHTLQNYVFAKGAFFIMSHPV